MTTFVPFAPRVVGRAPRRILAPTKVPRAPAHAPIFVRVRVPPTTDTWVWPNVSKTEWGRRGWRWLHVRAIKYPKNPTQMDATKASSALVGFIHNLPCAECRNHAIRYFRRNPPDLHSSEALQIWAWRFHNAVNARLGKSLISYEMYQLIYSKELATFAA
jgi:hypothetical protein